MTTSIPMRIDKKLADKIRIISKDRDISMVEASRIIGMRFIEIEYDELYKKFKI